MTLERLPLLLARVLALALLAAAPAHAGTLGRAGLQALLPPTLLLWERSPNLPA